METVTQYICQYIFQPTMSPMYKMYSIRKQPNHVWLPTVLLWTLWLWSKEHFRLYFLKDIRFYKKSAVPLVFANVWSIDNLWVGSV